MWNEHINQGKQALNARNLVIAESAFRDALECARRDFGHTDTRIPETFGYLGRALLLQKKVKEAASALRQAARISKTLNHASGPIAIADYLWAYIDHQDKNAEQRRNEKLQALQGYMQDSAIEKLNKELRDIFTVRPTPEEPPPKAEAAEPEVAQPSTSPTADIEESEQVPVGENLETPVEPIVHQVTAGEGAAQAQAVQAPVQESEPSLKPYDKPDSELELQLEPKAKVETFKPVFGVVTAKTEQKEEKGPIAPERFQLWADRLNKALERSKKPQLSELIGSYVDMHDLMNETVILYVPPHPAVGDHLMGLADIANAIGLYNRAGGLYELAVEILSKALGPHHPKTAYAQIYLAQVYGTMDSYDKAHHHFRGGFNTLQNYAGLDKQWFQENIEFFNLLIKRESVEKELFQSLEQIGVLIREQRYDEADRLCLALSDKIHAVFPPDHYNLCFLYHRHAVVLANCGRMVESSALSRLAIYLESKIKDREEYNKQMEEIFPEFPLPTLNALYCHDR
ncbi:MAG: tetratricopeptide repeat protein [Cyanobacteria bacterium]|nr:tetratricopeptide repeat protein [Cyanobacteriota bacterium]